MYDEIISEMQESCDPSLYYDFMEMLKDFENEV